MDECKPLVIGAYYSRISLARLGELLCLPAQETEKHLSDLVTTKKVGSRHTWRMPATLSSAVSTALYIFV